MATLFGILVGGFLVIAGILSGNAEPEVFVNWQGLAIVLGGTIAATFVSFPFPEVLRGFKSYFVIFRSGVHNNVKAIENIVMAVRIFQKEGVQALSEKIKNLQGLWVLKDGLSMLANSYTREEARAILEDHVRWKMVREHKQSELFQTMSRIAPAFGMIGTLIGLINMLMTLQEQPGQVGIGLAIALTTTFYGLILSNMVFAPIAAKIKERAEANLLHETLQVEAVLMMYDKQNYVYVRDKLAALLSPAERFKLSRADSGARRKIRKAA